MTTETANNKTILLVEDEIDLVELYTELLTEQGYNVISAYDGDDGLYKIGTTQWDLLLLDIMLPEKDGMAVLEDIQKTSGTKKGPILMLTNLNSEDLIERAMNLGADGYIIKSEVTLQDISEKVKKYLG